VTPRCTIVIATHERPDELAGCLGAVAELDYPPGQLDVVVVDDGGTTPLDSVLRAAGDLPVELIRQRQAGPAAARNRGAKAALGEVLAFTDDDCRPAQDWLARLVRHWGGRPDVAVGGHTVNALTENVYAATSQLVIDAGYRHNNRDRANAQFFTSNNLLVPAEPFRSLGGFDASFTTSEDRDFCDRWIARGNRLEYVPTAVVMHRHNLSLQAFCRQQFAYGRGAFRFHRAHSLRRSRNVRIEPSFYAELFAYPLRHERGLRALKLSLLLQVWNVVNLLGFGRAWWEWRRQGGR
jgi:GT2 family glycosyltransferase